jgi:uncharacterized phage protein (TIGR02220 family)
MEGWIKLHRKIAQWQWASSPNHMSLFMQLLLRANHKPSKWRKETIGSGQLLTGRKQLMDWTGLSEMQIRKCLDDLESTSEIIRKRTAKYSIITIANWKTYQSDNREITVQYPLNNQQTTTSNNVNNNNNEKNNIINCEAFTGSQSLEEVSSTELGKNIITALNSICSKSFRPTAAHMRFINARINEGYALEDFKAVIQDRNSAWANNPEMSAYLRPSTLFGTKFDSYLQESKNPIKSNLNASFKNNQNSGFREVPQLTERQVELLKKAGQI